jgi:hypothetical protein
MSYSGTTYHGRFNQLGFNHNPNIDKIPQDAMVHPSRNINLHEDGAGSRGGTSHVHPAAYGGSQVMGMFDFRLNNGNQFLVAVTTDGKIWKDTTTTIKTGLTTGQFASFVVMNNELYVCNGADIPQVWDGAGASTSNLANVPTDWTGSNYPQVMVLHGRGNSERLWAFGCSSNPNTVYASEVNDGSTEADFSDANVTTIYIETQDGTGIVGGVEFGDRLILYGRLKSYIIDDTDTNDANWGYESSQWDSGLASWRLLVRTPSDIVAFQEDGNIYSVTAVQEYGDYKLASLSRPAHIDRWIRQYIDLSRVGQFHAIYNPILRAIDFYMVYSGDTTVSMALRYFIDRGPMKGWAPQDNQSYASGYDASASCLYLSATGTYKVYTGDYSGNVWELETANKNDNSNGYYAGVKTASQTYSNDRMPLDNKVKKYRDGRIISEANATTDLSVKITIDGTDQDTRTVALAGTGDVFGTGLFGTATFTGDELIDTSYELGYRGTRIQKEFFNTSANEPFFLSQDLTNFKILGVRPQ